MSHMNYGCFYLEMRFDRSSAFFSGKMNVNDEELEEMLKEGKGPINFTVFLTLFGEKLNGEFLLQRPKM